ncbi:MAG TPA: hypothetical protein VGB19_14065 [Actinomycetota bacterium]
MRFELPEGLSPQEEQAVLAALERYFAEEQKPPALWALAGRVDASGMGAVQTRRITGSSWRAGIRMAFARRGTPTFIGRGDAR